VRIRLRQGVPAGTVHLALDEAEYEVALPPGMHVVDMVSLDLPSGTSRLEAWLHTDDPAPDARHGRFIPALYVEVEGVRR
jgi:hypothetical protein